MSLAQHLSHHTVWPAKVPTYRVTKARPGCFHRFFDTSPISPDGRFLATTRLASEDRLPVPGDVAEVVVFDLENGSTNFVAETRGADTQLGAGAQWGPDGSLYFHDLDPGDWQPFGVRVYPDGRTQRLAGPIYMISPDGTQTAFPCLLRTGSTQAGYGVIAPPEVVPRNHGAADDDGLWVADTTGGPARLLLSYAAIVEEVGDHLDDPAKGDFYGFHVKWNLAGDRLMFVIRWVPHDGSKVRPALICCRADGSQPTVAVPADLWSKGGHHPDWAPDGERVTINLKHDWGELRFAIVDHDGGNLQPLTESVRGSGHPTLHPDGRHLVTDAYVHEPMAYDNGDVPIRGVELPTGVETELVRIPSLPPYVGPKRELRLDPHPAWDSTRRYLAFNGCPDGTREVLIADLGEWLAG